MAAAFRPPILVTAVRSQSDGSPNPDPSRPLPCLSIAKPSWVVRTESIARKERMKKPNPPCVVCNGSGRVDCHHCRGKGRTNCVNLEMLPRGEWPKWTCGGSGLDYCSRCVGTGEYRDMMGFHFMKTDINHNGRPHEVSTMPKGGNNLIQAKILKG